MHLRAIISRTIDVVPSNKFNYQPCWHICFAWNAVSNRSDSRFSLSTRRNFDWHLFQKNEQNKNKLKEEKKRHPIQRHILMENAQNAFHAIKMCNFNSFSFETRKIILSYEIKGCHTSFCSHFTRTTFH